MMCPKHDPNAKVWKDDKRLRLRGEKMEQTSLYEIFEIEIPGDQPEAVARDCASFRQPEGEKIVVSAFRKRAGVFAVRFLPRRGYCKVAYEKQEPKKSAPLEP